MVGMQPLPIGHNHWQIYWRCQHTLKTLSRFDEDKNFFLAGMGILLDTIDLVVPS